MVVLPYVFGIAEVQIEVGLFALFRLLLYLRVYTFKLLWCVVRTMELPGGRTRNFPWGALGHW